jgi:hypothetical protein
MLFVLILFLPALQQNLGILPETLLMGKEESAARPHLSMASWLDGSFQEQYGKRRDGRLGLRDYLVKTNNQIHYSLFRRVVSTTGTDVVIGKNNWLYEMNYIDKLNTATTRDGSLIETKVRSLRRLQDKLEKLGIAFVFVIAPSKAEVYPEYIPDSLRKEPLPADAATDYRQATASLEKHGVRYLDGHALFLNEKQEGGRHLFGPSGTHWNKYGAYLVWKNLVPLVEDRLRVPLRIPPLEKIELRPSEPGEADLGRVLNLWDNSFASPPTDYPVFASPPTSEKKKPSILIIGDSFLFTLVDIVERANLSTDVDAWYYFKRHFKYRVKDGRITGQSEAIETPVSKETIDWRKQLLEKDLVILVATEYWLPELGFGFIKPASGAIKRFAKGQKQ